MGSARYQNMVKLASHAKYRLLLTGTPLQNNINELWALLNFLMPDIFNFGTDFRELVSKKKKKNFSEIFFFQVWPEGDDEASKTQNDKEVTRLKKLIDPFLLRRLKSEVLDKLPEKTEKILWCEMTPAQASLYQQTYQVRVQVEIFFFFFTHSTIRIRGENITEKQQKIKKRKILR